MHEYEYPDRTTNSDDRYRLSWLAYVGVTIKLLAMVGVCIGIGWLALNKSDTDQAQLIGIGVSVVFLIVAIARFVYKVLYLKSFYLYIDNVGVWLYQGTFPWSRGCRGVKWRDIEDAKYITGFFIWLFCSYSVRIGHRFTETSEIFVTHLARGNKAVEHINQMHQKILKSERLAI